MNAFWKKILCCMGTITIVMSIVFIVPTAWIMHSEKADAASGGPDTYGYRYRDSASGATYSWISHTGAATTVTGRTDDSATGAINIGFTFSYYGVNQTQLYICNNGYVTFVSSCAYTNIGIPSSASPNSYIAPWWDDLYTSGTVKYELFGSAPNRYMVISWEGINHINYTTADVTFQAILYETSNTIKFQYSDVVFGGSASLDYGNSATIGIENSTGADGLQYAYNTISLSNSLAIEFGYSVDPSMTQSAYRMFGNRDSADVGSALAADNTAPTLTVKGEGFRLRMLLHVSAADVTIGTGSFKLQYVGKGGGTCASPSSGDPVSWTDVSATTHIAYKDNATPTNASALTANGSDPTHSSDTIVNQTYVESNNFTNSQGAVLSGQDGKWDFSLYDYNSSASKTYCLRAVYSSSGNALSAYTYYPEVTTRASSGGPDSYGYEWNDSDGTGGAYSWIDISGTGTSIGSRGDDQMKGPYNIGFDFNFYGNTQTQFYICNNGYISFSNDTCEYTNATIPTTGIPNNFIAPWWDDLTTGGTIYYETKGTYPNKYLVVSFVGISRLNATGDVTFQAILYQSSNKIRFQYNDVNFVEEMYDAGRQSTTGIENSSGSIGTEIGFNSWHLANSYAIDFTLRYQQAAYRFFTNQNGVTVGSALSTQDTATTLAADGDQFRVRMLIRNNDSDLAVSSQSFKLQYVEKGAGTCASPSGTTPASWTDVDSTTSIAYYDNATPTDGTALTTNGSDPTFLSDTVQAQTYEEANNFTNSQAIIASGQDGEWDFSLYDKTASAGTTLCLRAVKSDGGVLNQYSVYPEITMASSQSLTFSIDDPTIGFGALSSLAAKYASADGTGASTDASAASNLTAASSSGYSITVQGATLTKASDTPTITAISSASTAYAQGTEQFGIYAVVSGGGSGAICANTTFGCGGDYSGASSKFFYNATAATAKKIAGCSSTCTSNNYAVHYLASSSIDTEAGAYAANLTFVATGTF